MRRLALLTLLAALTPASALAAKQQPIQIKTLSNRADLVSDGQALVQIRLPRGADASHLKVTLEGRDVSDAFSHGSGRRREGVVDGLALGANELVARAPGATGASLEITNHRNGGPIFGGPQPQPWFCQQGAVDKQRNQPAQYTYLYRSTDRTKTGLQPYDPKNPPSDVATTTTDEDITVPF